MTRHHKAQPKKFSIAHLAGLHDAQWQPRHASPGGAYGTPAAGPLHPQRRRPAHTGADGSSPPVSQANSPPCQPGLTHHMISSHCRPTFELSLDGDQRCLVWWVMTLLDKRAACATEAIQSILQANCPDALEMTTFEIWSATCEACCLSRLLSVMSCGCSSCN